MEVRVLIDCPAERLELIGELGAAVGTPLVDDGGPPALRYDFSGAATKLQDSVSLGRIWPALPR
jgi:hypothetical protein